MKDVVFCVKDVNVSLGTLMSLIGWARRTIGNEVRSQCVFMDFATTLRDEVFAPTPSLVRGFLVVRSLV